MSHSDVFAVFKDIYLIRESGVLVDKWYPNGKNSIRVKLIGSHTELIFSYKSRHNWKLETRDSFVDELSNSLKK